MIQIFNLYKTYKGNTQALIDISLEIKSGEFVFLTGQSGAGKSTLLKILYSWENFDKGQILINGINIAKIREDNQYTLRRRIGVVFQDYRLLPRKTVFENISFAQEAIESPSDKIRFKTWEALKKVGLTQKKDSFPLQLAGGEQQRVAIARALVNSPEILLADEPTGNLDPKIALEILKLFEHANSQGVTVIFATHSAEMLKATNYRVINLSKGRLISSK
jgi:cell division transport system ATP-binding protein